MQKLKGFLKFIFFILLMVAISILFERQLFFWGIVIIFFILDHMFSKIKYLETKTMQKEEKSMGSITDIIDFSLSFGSTFWKTLKEKTGYDDTVIEKIKKEMPTGVTCKIETYEKDFDIFTRLKTWTFKEGKQQSFEEYDDPKTTNIEIEDFPIWEILFNDFFETEDRGLELSFSFDDYEFHLYLTGSRFELKDKEEHFIDFRKWKEKTKKEAILFRLEPYNFKELEKYHAANIDYFPKDPDYYIATEQYRCYGDRFAKNEKVIKDFHWTLQLFDFTKEKLPKLEKKN